MSDSDVAEVLSEISSEVSRELVAHGQEHSCISGAALLASVLHRVGFPDAYPLTVGVRIFNRAYQDWVEKNGPPHDEASGRACDDAGGAQVMLGKGTEGIVPDDRWPGHLVVIIPKAFGDRHALLDLTIVQAQKPEWGIHLQPLCLRVRDEFVKGGDSSNFHVRDSLVCYDAHPDDHSYNDDGDWMSIEGLDEAASNVIDRLNRT